MRLLATSLLLACALSLTGQVRRFGSFFEKCRVTGSATIFDLRNQQWIYSDPADAARQTLPASTFKIFNLLVALETGTIRDENELFRWKGAVDTARYGYRPETYKDLTVKEAFTISAVWVFLELAERIGKEKYSYYMKLCHYGNADTSGPGTDFWNFGPMAISPVEQVRFMVGLHEESLPFSKRSMEIVKKVLVTEQAGNYTIHAKTGWFRTEDTDTGWWTGWLESKGNTWFFATRISKKRSDANPGFSNCRKDITRSILRELKAFD